MQPDVSFVIAAYNAEATLGRAIDSALAQQGVTVEVIVVDDCSSDATIALARAYADPRVRVVALEKNRGPGGARNAGLDAALGRWVAVLDSDDAVLPDRLSAMIGRADAGSAAIAVDNIVVVHDDGRPSEVMFAESYLEKLGNLTLADFISSNVVFEATFNFGYMKPIFLREYLQANELRYDENLRIGEDYILLASALARGGICAVEPAVGYAYHVRNGSISRVLELHHVEAMQRADATFAARNRLEGEAQKAFTRRARSLSQAASFLSLVTHIKQRSPLKAVRTALGDPAAVRHLRMPIEVRLRRLARQFA
ncbi:succinoglycan biosynthesis protein ExoO [Aminobacter aminovorans]|uniref:Chondroitin polymerase n=1 Tax=Aminobacter aminovorans TaxID=83263 RepID=A0A380WHF7_AMIAI|nr:glycosyltransferase family 2 protein [Aminobacter aminovorans]TCS27149.1 succinoglycan biosynthesis protein ExoO [Aminobacter aminovorans]SUU87792.1 Chondroitin polymerase [Aminobacter aminovorans]